MPCLSFIRDTVNDARHMAHGVQHTAHDTRYSRRGTWRATHDPRLQYCHQHTAQHTRHTTYVARSVQGSKDQNRPNDKRLTVYSVTFSTYTDPQLILSSLKCNLLSLPPVMFQRIDEWNFDGWKRIDLYLKIQIHLTRN